MPPYATRYTDRDNQIPPDQRKYMDEELNIGLMPQDINTTSAQPSSSEKVEASDDLTRPNTMTSEVQNANNLIIKSPKIPKKLLIIWRISIILLFFISFLLLYLLSVSVDPSGRNKWSVIKVNLPNDQFSSILNSAKGLDDIVSVSDQQDDANAAEEQAKRGEKDDDDGGGGWLAVNIWGWCLQDSAKTEIVCSKRNMLYDLDDLLGEESKSSAPSGDHFNFLLIHGLIIHAFVATMPIIPIAWNTYRTIRSDQPSVESGWGENGTLLTTCLFCFIAYIIDRLLKSSVKNNLPNHKVISGQALTTIGVISILLFITFLLSSLPPFYLHTKRQSQLVKYWEDLEDFDEVLADEEDEGDRERRRKKRGRGRVKRSRTRRFTNMVFGKQHENGDRGGRGGGGGGLRREGTLSRWRSRRRDRHIERRERRRNRYEDEDRDRRGRGRGRDRGRGRRKRYRDSWW